MLVALSFIYGVLGTAHADRFVFDDGSGKLRFDMVASLHDVPGQAKNFSGELTVDENVTGKISVQVSGMTTGIGARDKRMYSYCLEQMRWPTIDFKIASATGNVAGLKSGKGSGNIMLHGPLTVRSSSREVAVPASYTWNGTDLSLKGSYKIKWTDFSVPDPSIIISTLYPDVEISFELGLRKTP